MPWVTINMLAGRSPEKKKQLHKKVTDAISETLEIPSDWVRIQLVEMSSEDHSIGGVQMNELRK